MKGSWQIVPDEHEQGDARAPSSSDLRRAGGLALVVLVVAASTALTLDRSWPTPTHGPSATPRPQAAVVPGAHSLANPCLDSTVGLSRVAGCSDYTRIIFTLPAGWAITDGLVYKHLDQPGEVAFSVWSLHWVYTDPCHWQASTLSPLDLGADGREGGLAHQVGRAASALIPVTLGGVRALLVELSVPAQLDLATCDRGEFRSWPQWDGADYKLHNAPGQIDVVYMVDVDRWPLVIDASHMPATSEADLAELEAILASMTIER